MANLTLRTSREFLADGNMADGAPIWGAKNRFHGWQPGEILLVVGDTGVGKSTLAMELALARLNGGEVGGFPVAESEGAVLYMALDREEQIRGLFNRSKSRFDWSFGEADRFLFQGNTSVFDMDLALDAPNELADLCIDRGITTLVIDSLQDATAFSLAQNDENARHIMMTLQRCTNAKVETILIHHARKATNENRRPTSLADTYGSRFFTAKAGSVVNLWRSTDDKIELSHLKQPVSTATKKVLLDVNFDTGQIDGTIPVPKADIPSRVVEIVNGSEDDLDREELYRLVHEIQELPSRSTLSLFHKDVLLPLADEGLITYTQGVGKGQKSTYGPGENYEQ